MRLGSALIARVNLRTVYVVSFVTVARVGSAVLLVAVAIVVGTRFLGWSARTHVCSKVHAAAMFIVARGAYAYFGLQ